MIIMQNRLIFQLVLDGNFFVAVNDYPDSCDAYPKGAQLYRKCSTYRAELMTITPDGEVVGTDMYYSFDRGQCVVPVDLTL